MTKLALLNTSIVTNDGSYSLKTIDLMEAQDLVSNSDLDSAIGHESTAQAMTQLLGVTVETNRQMFAQEVGQEALVFKLNGRPPEGAVLSREQLEDIGYSWKLLTRLA
jgi:hypothetical protein